MYYQQDQKCFHDHPKRFNVIFTCQECGKISEQSNNVLTAVASEMIEDMSFKAEIRMIECPGVCKECQSS